MTMVGDPLGRRRCIEAGRFLELATLERAIPYQAKIAGLGHPVGTAALKFPVCRGQRPGKVAPVQLVADTT